VDFLDGLLHPIPLFVPLDILVRFVQFQLPVGGAYQPVRPDTTAFVPAGAIDFPKNRRARFDQIRGVGGCLPEPHRSDGTDEVFPKPVGERAYRDLRGHQMMLVQFFRQTHAVPRCRLTEPGKGVDRFAERDAAADGLPLWLFQGDDIHSAQFHDGLQPGDG
jgi:hypothetical protein